MAISTNTNNNGSLPPPAGLTVTLKIALASIIIGTLATLVTALIAYILFARMQEETVRNSLGSLRTMLENRLASHVDNLKLDSESLAQSAGVRQLLAARLADMSDPSITTTFDTFHQSLARHAQRLRYHDIYLCDPSGKIIYNTLDPKSTLPDSSLLGELCRDVVKGGQTTLLTNERGIERGSESIKEAVLLCGSAILTGEKVYAVLVIESSLSPINSVMSFNEHPQEVGLGQTGEAYLIDSSFTVRTRLRNPTRSKIQSDGARSAIGGNSGSSTYKNADGQNVLGSYNRLKVDGLPWGILVEQQESEALEPARSAAFLVAGVGFIVIVLVGVSGFSFARIFAKPIVNLEETIRKVSSGDESARAVVESHDEIGQLATALNEMIVERNGVKDRISTENKRVQANIQDFLLVVADASEGKLGVRAKRTEGLLGNVADALNRMLENVSALIGEAKSASSQVQESAGEIAASAQTLADGASSQTEQISQTILEVQNLAAEAQGVSENSQEAALAATRTRQAAEDGAKAVRDVIAYMERLQESVQTNARKITRLGERSQEISGIVRSISELSAETDVLAMNASIEAARAGEQGKGFTVVADQVRALADRTREATVEIEKLVMGIQSETAEAVKQMEHANIEVENGTRQVSSAGASLGNIVEASVDSSTLANQISQSATQQEQRAQAMLQAIVAINQIAEDTRNRTLDFRETSDLLATLATELNKQLANFEVARQGQEA
jgi:methyl-accepting chemotaxis protein